MTYKDRKERMKIGIFTDSYFPRVDGVAISVDICAEKLQAMGHDVYIIAPRHPVYKDKKDNVYRLTSIKFISDTRTQEARVVIPLPEKALLDVLKIGFDIIHGHSTVSGITFWGLQIARSRNIPYVITYHTLWNQYTHYILHGKVVKPKMMEVISRLVVNFSDCVIAPTKKVKKELLSYGVKRKIEVFPNGIDMETFLNTEKGFLRKKIKADHTKKILLSCGRLGKEKSFDFLLEAFSRIHAGDENTVFVLAGEGNELKKLKHLAENLGIADVVYFIGKIDHQQMHRIYADADVFLYASQSETQGLVVLEALASGIPVVAVRDESLVDFVHSGENGFLVKKDIKIFTDSVLQILQNPSLAASFSQHAREIAAQFSSDITMQQLEALYKKLIIQKGRKHTKNRGNYARLISLLQKTNSILKNVYAKLDV